MFYKTKIDYYILDSATYNMLERGPFADAYGRACGSCRKERKQLISQLKKQGLHPIEAAAVVSAWLAQKAPLDRENYPISRELHAAHNALLVNKRYCKPQERIERLKRVNYALQGIGLNPDEAGKW